MTDTPRSSAPPDRTPSPMSLPWALSFRRSGALLVVLVVGLASLGACNDGAITDPPGPARLRVVNAVRNQSKLFPGDSIDVAVDSSTAPPGAGALGFGAATPYADLGSGIHSYFARVTGDGRTGGPENILRFVPRLQAVGGFTYTMVMTGVVPPEGVEEIGAVSPVYVTDDRFPPSRVPGGTELHARFKVINAAPYAAGATAGTLTSVYLTPGAEAPPTSVSALVPRATASYRNTTRSVEVVPGTYYLTVATAARRIVAQQQVTFAAGAARTLVLISTSPAPTPPSPANHALITLADADF